MWKTFPHKNNVNFWDTNGSIKISFHERNSKKIFFSCHFFTSPVFFFGWEISSHVEFLFVVKIWGQYEQNLDIHGPILLVKYFRVPMYCSLSKIKWNMINGKRCHSHCTKLVEYKLNVKNSSKRPSSLNIFNSYWQLSQINPEAASTIDLRWL